MGGPYIGVHWRRKDFVRAHVKDLPSIEGAAKQLATLADKLGLTTIFLATDAPEAGKAANLPSPVFHCSCVIL